ncbi:MAG: cupin [Magnetococcales bacterium]|nr:cupin [Magnetococcales bacterium]MBF0173962.1 cupin [Magnetococcales bacterium]MBF0632127.1 cupin [Magnetococcales bacterium]
MIKEMPIVEKPWGREHLVVCNEHYAFKKIEMIAGTRSSLQSHERKVETIFVHSGRIRLEVGEDRERLEAREYGPNEAYHLNPGLLHRVTVLADCTLFEVSTPQLDDVIRHADDYNRT